MTAVFLDNFGFSNGFNGISSYTDRLFSARLMQEQRKYVISKIWVGDKLPVHPVNGGIFPINKKMAPFYAKVRFLWPNYAQRLIATDYKKPIIFHGLSNINIPIRTKLAGCHRVITIHDIIPLLDNSSVSWKYYIEFKVLFKKVLEVADAILCVSNWTRQSILNLYPAYEAKIFVVLNGRDVFFQRPQGKQKQTNKIRLLTVSRWENYKGFETLIKLAATKKYQMTIVTDSKGLAFFKQEARLLLEQGILQVFIRLSHEELQYQYKTADLLVHPSLYEGFCLPVVEAFSQGLGVVYYAGTAIDEITQDAIATKVFSQDRDAWIAAIEEGLCKTQQVDFYENLENHLQSLPSWEFAAQQVLAAYDKVLDRA